MTETESTSLLIQVVAILIILGLTALPYFIFERAKFGLAFCMKVATIEAIFLAGWYVFGAAIVAPVTTLVVMQGLIGGLIVSAIVLGFWLVVRRVKAAANG